MHRKPVLASPESAMTSIPRRQWLLAASACAASGLPGMAFAQDRRFEPQPGRWRTFEVTTRVQIRDAKDATRVWLPIPSIDSDYQRSLDSTWSGNATAARIVTEPVYGARMLQAEFDASTAAPQLVLTSRVQTQDRALDWNQSKAPNADADLARWTRPTELMPTDGIVLDTARSATRFAWSDEAKVKKLYDWVVANTYREPTVKGCGIGDIKTMLETGNLGGKCGDINALFVGLCRALDIPARDVYGIRIAPSAFGYRELGGNPAKLQGAQHCRAEVWLKAHGWVAMDPADVGKVMRLEAGEWIKDERHALVAPVKRALFGGWEGNWMAFNTAHDVMLPGSRGPALGFFMYPQAENANGRYDALDPDNFSYTITSREVTA